MKPRPFFFQHFSISAFQRLLLASSLLAAVTAAHAVDYTWSGQYTGGQWQNEDNWVGGVTPTFNANADIFFYATGAGRLSNFISANRTVGSLNFNDNADSAVNIRLATTNSGGTAANLTMGSSTVAPSINVSSGAAGNIEIGQSDGSIILLNNLTVNHEGSGTLTLSRPIIQSGGNRSLTKSGTGTLILRGSAANTFAGGLTFSGGTLNINYTEFNSNNLVDSNNSLTLSNGGNLTVTGFSTGSNTQPFAGTTFSAGRSVITTTPTGTGGAVTLNLGTITRQAGSVVQFAPGTAWSNTAYSTNNVVTTTAPGGSGVSFVGPGFFSGTGNLTRYVQIANSGDNAGQFRLAANNTPWNTGDAASATTLYGITASRDVTSDQTMYALQPNLATDPFAATLKGGSIQLNGILNINTGTFSILQGDGGGQVRIGAVRDLVISAPHTGGITIDAPIVDHDPGSGAVASSVTSHQLGSGAITLSNTNTFSGGLYVTTGTLTVGSGGTTGTLGTGAVSNAGTLLFNRTDTYTLAAGNLVTGAGAVTLANTGAVATAVDNQFNTTGALNFGAAAASTIVSSLDLTSGSSAFGAMVVRTNSTTSNTITIGSGKTLQNNGSVSFGDNNTVALARTGLTVSGAGTWNVTSSGGNMRLGLATGANNRNSITLDMSALGTFNADLGSTGTFRVGDNNTSSSNTTPSSATLAVNSTITAGTLGIGDQTGTSGVQTLKLGSGTQIINANTISIGLNSGGASAKRSSGSLVFNGEDGTLKIRAANGTDAAALNMFVAGTNTGAGTTATFNTAGHSADLLFSTVNMVNTSQNNTTGSGDHVATFTFDSGTLAATNFRIGTRAATATGAGINTATVFIGQTAIGTSANLANTADLGTVTMATVTSTIGTMNGALNIGGTNTSVGITSLTVANNNAAATGGTANGIVTISGGATTLTNGITLAAQTTADAAVSGSLILNGGTLTLGNSGITTSVAGSSGVTTNLTLNGGTLDMNGQAIGASGTGAITFNAQAGELRDVASINGSGGLTKTTGGTLTLTGTNTYTGDTSIQDGTLALGAAATLADTSAFHIAAGATLDTTAKASFTMPAGKTFTFGVNAADTGTSGTLTAGDLVITDAVVALDITGTLDDPAYVLATYSTLTGTAFATAPNNIPSGYELKYDYQGNKIALVKITTPSNPYETWAGVGVAFGDDANGDGIDNGLAFLLGAANPQANALGLLPTTSQSGGALVLTFQMRNAAARGTAKLNLQHSSDLGISDPWATVLVPDTTPDPQASDVSFIISAGTLPDTVTVTATIAAGQAANGKLFGRCSASEN